MQMHQMHSPGMNAAQVAHMSSADAPVLGRIETLEMLARSSPASRVWGRGTLTMSGNRHACCESKRPVFFVITHMAAETGGAVFKKRAL